MHNIEIYMTYLWIYIQSILVFCLIGLIIINLFFGALKLSNLFYEKRIWMLTNLIVVIITIVSIAPAFLDIYKSSFCTINGVVKIEIDVIANKSSKYILITDEGGTVYTCYDYLIDTDSIKKAAYPGTAVYAKHSKLMLDYYPHNDKAEKEAEQSSY